MRILWLCNVIIPGISKLLNLNKEVLGGWLEETFERLIEDSNNNYAYCAPCGMNGITIKEYKRAIFYGFNESNRQTYKYDHEIENNFKNILEHFRPDIVHIFGTEYPHSLAMVRAFNNSSRTIIHIQGLAFL